MILQATLADLCTIAAGGTPLRGNSEYYENGTIPWIKSGELAQGEIHTAEECITHKGLAQSSAKIFPVDTVLIAMYGATVGSVGILKIESATNQAVCGIRTPPALLPEYLYYFLRSKRDYLVRQAAGGGQPNISAKTIKNLIIRYPEDIREQQRIVAELKTRLSATDTFQAGIRRQMADMQAYIQQRMHDLLIGRKTDAWVTGAVENFAVVNPSVRDMSRKPRDDEPVSFVPMSAVSAADGCIAQSIVRPYAEVRKGYTYFEEGDILFAKITPCMQNGKIAVAHHLENGIGFGSTEFHVIRAKGPVISRWLYYLFRRNCYLARAAANMQGAVGQQRLPDAFIRQTGIAFPNSIEEQRTITEQLAGEIDRCTALTQKLQTQLNNLTALRTRIFLETFDDEE